MDVYVNQADATKRRLYFQVVDVTDGMTPETGEAGGQPQISVNGAAWTNTGIGTLVHVGNGRYYGQLTQAIVANGGDTIEGRYKSANTAEIPAETVQVVSFPPGGAGAKSFPVTVTELDGVTPIAGVDVWITTDVAGANTVAGTLVTDALGQINGSVGFLLDIGSYYLWRQKPGYNPTNPVAITVS